MELENQPLKMKSWNNVDVVGNSDDLHATHYFCQQTHRADSQCSFLYMCNTKLTKNVNLFLWKLLKFL